MAVSDIHKRKPRMLIIMRNCGIIDADEYDSVEASMPFSGPGMSITLIVFVVVTPVFDKLLDFTRHQQGHC